MIRVRDDWPLLLIGASLLAVYTLATLREAGIL